jgi:hypothetical protein
LFAAVLFLQMEQILRPTVADLEAHHSGMWQKAERWVSSTPRPRSTDWR